MDGEINYNQLVERALVDVVRKSLQHAAEHGLSGQQHFYITFLTQHPGVSIPSHLTERYKDEMTIVLQHQYWNLLVEHTYFSLELSFNHKREVLTIPFDAVTAFADPSVQFGLQFNLSSEEFDTSSKPAIDEDNEEPKADPSSEATEAEDTKPGEVITLDAFRKK